MFTARYGQYIPVRQVAGRQHPCAVAARGSQALFLSHREKDRGDTLDALNEGEIPSIGSIVEVFNKEILERCLKLYSKEMSSLQLPVPGDKLLLAHEVSKAKANNLFDQQYFGRRSAKQSLLNFNNEIQKVNFVFIVLFTVRKPPRLEFALCSCSVSHTRGKNPHVTATMDVWLAAK
ncbi:hypothetical protein BHM03_00036903 [Ensete ventricosum]|nr:hypothetical protein BHM03_00036903 [Ensete ventricosum]